MPTPKIIAVDFDNTIVEQRYPQIGEPLPLAQEGLQALRDAGWHIIIWTCRSGERLEQARKFLDEGGYAYDEINENSLVNFGDPKLFANLYLDDRSFPPFPGWEAVMEAIRNDTLKTGMAYPDHVKSVAAGLVLYGLPEVVQNLPLWVEACRRVAFRGSGSALDVYQRLGGRLQAMLIVDELDQYYTGSELPSYCSNCKNADYAPSGKIGCLSADDADVRDFLNRFQENDLLFEDERCPGFEVLGTDQAVMMSQGVRDMEAALIKEVPAEPLPEIDPQGDVQARAEILQIRQISQMDEEGYLDLLEDAVGELFAQTQSEDADVLREVIGGCIRELQKLMGHAEETQIRDYTLPEWK